MKKVKKRAQTVEIPAGDERASGERAGEGEEVIEGSDPGVLEDSDLLVEESDSLEATDPGVPEAAAFQEAEELTPVRPVGLDGVLLGGAEVSPETSWDGPTTEGDLAELAALREASRGDGVAAEVGVPRGGAHDETAEAAPVADGAEVAAGEIAAGEAAAGEGDVQTDGGESQAEGEG